MISTVHGRPHEIAGSGVDAHIFFIYVLEADDLCHKISVRAGHIPAHFGKYLKLHAVFCNYLIIDPVNSFAYSEYIHRFFIRMIRYPYAS